MVEQVLGLPLLTISNNEWLEDVLAVCSNPLLRCVLSSPVSSSSMEPYMIVINRGLNIGG